MKKNIIFILIAILILSLTACGNKQQESSEVSSKIEFTDDSGVEIKLEKPAKKIISLYSAHTENLFELGLKDEIIGVSTNDIYPLEAQEIEQYDYKGDPEKIIEANPDLVLIRPFIKRSKPDFVEIIESAGIKVVSLYPENFEAFDDYINKLGLITGKEKEANEKLRIFHEELQKIENLTKQQTTKPNIYFESSQKEYKTITIDSTAAKAIELAGGNNVVQDAVATKKGSTIAEYGAEKLISKGSEIDIFISQVGVMNAGVSVDEIKQRPGFDTIKAIEQNKVYIIEEKIISSPTFRFLTGVKELSRIFYPEVFDDISKYQDLDMIKRKEMAEIIVKYNHDQVFVPDSKYYNEERINNHTYGDLKDIQNDDDYYDFIETAINKGYFDFIDFAEHKFEPEKTLTKEECIFIVEKLNGNKDKLSDANGEIGFKTFIDSLK